MSEQKNLKTINPATGKAIDTYDLMSDNEMEQAIKDCHQAFLKWKMKSAEERAEVIKNIGKKLDEHKQELSKLMTSEMGKLLKQGEQEIELCSGICEYTAKNGPESLKDEERELPEGGTGYITYSPLGVIYGIQPWNFPSYQVVRYSIANLMAGNGVLLKHAENVTGSALLLEKIYREAGLPENLFKVLL
ncbi:MAG TPA: aldehyde dehydrogenase family protein, partial [Christiangramia sp.]|nr:aldehyde dehydrogenase family protein [Christiangramia sp.]